MKTLEKIRAALATRPGKMPSEAYRRAALTLMHGRALDLPDAEFDALAVTLGLTDPARHAASERLSAQVSGHVSGQPSGEQPSTGDALTWGAA